jgi:hypothetical protein
LAVTTYGIDARFTVVTLTGTAGRRGGADFEQAAITTSAKAAAHNDTLRVIMGG